MNSFAKREENEVTLSEKGAYSGEITDSTRSEGLPP